MDETGGDAKLSYNMGPRKWYATALRTERGRRGFHRGLLSFLLHVLAFMSVPRPFSIAVATWFLMVFTKLFFVSGFYWSYHGSKSERVRGLLRRIVTPRNMGAYVGAGGQSTLLGNLALMFLFFWPLPLIAYQVGSQ